MQQAMSRLDGKRVAACVALLLFGAGKKLSSADHLMRLRLLFTYLGV